MTLTKDQIQELYKFTRAHYVEYYDVQTELVDHLANGIEAQWKEYPNLSFEEAKQKEFKKFGVFGFMDVVAERQKVMSKKYYGIIFKFFKAYFQLPKIILTFCVIVLLAILLQKFHLGHLHYWVSGILLLGVSPMLFSMWMHSKKLKKKKRKWMLEDMLFNHVGVAQLLVLPIHLFNFEYTAKGIFGFLTISLFIVVLLLLVYVITFEIPTKAEKLLEETYPEYKMT